MGPSCTAVISVENRKIFTPAMHFAPLVTGFPLELSIGTVKKKLEWWGYQKRSKKFYDRFSRLHTIPASDGQTDTARRQSPLYPERRARRNSLYYGSRAPQKVLAP